MCLSKYKTIVSNLVSMDLTEEEEGELLPGAEMAAGLLAEEVAALMAKGYANSWLKFREFCE